MQVSENRGNTAELKSADSVRTVLDYHERTKHHFSRYARSLGFMDWDTQPDPFRRYEGAELLPLDPVPAGPTPEYDAVFRPEGLPVRPVDRAGLSQLFYDSLAVSAWKVHGQSRWALRVNPSSGNLHPTEGYLVAPAVAGLRDRPAVYHYAPLRHGLEVRADLSADDWSALTDGLPAGSVLVGLSSIHWREAWKYGERAYRYCQHDVGHAVAAVTIAAAVLGWETRMLEGLGDRDLARLLGIAGQNGIEAEHPDCLLVLYPRNREFPPEAVRQYRLDEASLAGIEAAIRPDEPNELSVGHHEWPIIDAVAAAAERNVPPGAAFWWQAPAPRERLPDSDRHISARRIIRQRRSAVEMDDRTSIPADTFYRMLGRLTPELTRVPYICLPWKPAVHLAVFVHRVEGLTPGLYLLVRQAGRTGTLRAAMGEQFDWERPAGCPGALPLYRLQSADCRKAARAISCHQSIASGGAFAVGMLAEFEGRIRAHGAWFYRRLFWETGVIGQVLYLEAEAAGIRGTGIGCFFDDGMHEVLGLADETYQSLYHFTVGGPLDDQRLRIGGAN